MFENIEWIFFDVGSTLVDEHLAYEHRFEDIAALSGVSYNDVYQKAMEFYRQNKKGDIETAKLFGVELTAWHNEDELPYGDAAECLKQLSKKYKIGIIANQKLGTKNRLEKYGLLKYIDLVISSAEEGVSKPDRRIFEIALNRGDCLPERAVMVGDRIDNDVIPAKMLGMHTVRIKQGYGKYWNTTNDIETPDCSVESLTELCEIL